MNKNCDSFSCPSHPTRPLIISHLNYMISPEDWPHTILPIKARMIEFHQILFQHGGYTAQFPQPWQQSTAQQSPEIPSILSLLDATSAWSTKVNLHTLQWPLSDFKCGWQPQNYTSGIVRGDGFIASSSVRVTFERSQIPQVPPWSSCVAVANLNTDEKPW